MSVKIKFSPTLSTEYESLFNGCAARPQRAAAVETTVNAIVANRARYEEVSRLTGVPWHVVGVIHNMESSLSFKRHLHNGDPLTARTVQVPAGRPAEGQPPFTWEQSAQDALGMHGLSGDTDWSLAGTLFQLERYNGWGYRQFHPHVPTPYLWGFSTHYTSGKYTADGTWSEDAVSGQCGAAVLLRRMLERGLIQFPDQPLPAPGSAPLVVPYSTSKPTDPVLLKRAEDLQRWLNTFPGIFVKVDGATGERTSDAFKRVTGHHLPGDPRGA